MSDESRFSIQKYEAVDFHYILRMTLGDGVRAWAIPRGPSPDPRVKRLAFPVEDDIPLDFEGIVDDGDKAGKVIVWDSGPYSTFDLDGQPLSMKDGLESGRVDFVLEGEKLQGGFTLLRIEEGKNERWLLMKISDEKATSRRNPIVTEPLSVLSGRTIEDVDDDS